MIEIWNTPIVAEISDIVDLLRIELMASGSYLLKDREDVSRNIQLTCIRHKDGMEDKPSMGVLTQDLNRDGKLHKAGSVNCFVCGYTADLPTFISDCFGYNDRGMFGFKWIAANFVNLSVEHRKDIALDMSRNQMTEEQKSGIEEEELTSYRFTHPYMYKRKLTDKVIDYFDVGYDRRTDSLTFPVHDLRGIPLFVQRRAVKGKRFQNDETTLKGSVLYGLYHVYRNLEWIKELHVTESIIDALTLWTHRHAAVATMQAIPTAMQIELLRKVPIRHIICSQDNDNAGDEGAKRLKKTLSDIKIISRLNFPSGVKDINELEDDELEDLSYRLM